MFAAIAKIFKCVDISSRLSAISSVPLGTRFYNFTRFGTTLFTMELGEGSEGKKAPLPVFLCKRRNKPQNFLSFSFKPFVTLM